MVLFMARAAQLQAPSSAPAADNQGLPPHPTLTPPNPQLPSPPRLRPRTPSAPLPGTALGTLFTIITLKLTLGTAGIIPSLNIPGGLISFAAIKGLTSAGESLRLARRAPLVHSLLFQPFGLQENAVLQT